jgi:hypothetical protein
MIATSLWTVPHPVPAWPCRHRRGRVESTVIGLAKGRLSLVPLLTSLDPFEDVDALEFDIVGVLTVSLEHLHHLQ